MRPTGLSQRLARHTRAQLKVLEQMLRRVIMLIAIGLSKDYTSVPRAKSRIRVLGGMSRLKSLRTPKLRTQCKEPQPHLPPLANAGCSDVDFSALPKDKRRKPVNLRKLINRIQTLQAVLENPEPMARRPRDPLCPAESPACGGPARATGHPTESTWCRTLPRRRCPPDGNRARRSSLE